VGLWEFVKRHRWTFVAAGGVLLLALSGVIYALAVRPGDLGFLERDGAELRWDRADVPVPCFYAPEVPEEFLQVYDRVREETTLPGGALLSPCMPWRLETRPESPRTGFLYLRTLPPSSWPYGASEGVTEHAYDKRTGQILGATVSVRADLVTDFRLPVLRHELGHSLGLAHDRERSSVMHENVSWRGGFGDRDLEALRKAYLE